MNGPLGSTISDKRVIYAWLCKKYSERNCEHKPHFTPTTFSLHKGKIIVKFGEIQDLCVFAYIFIQNIVFKCNFTVLTFYNNTLLCDRSRKKPTGVIYSNNINYIS